MLHLADLLVLLVAVVEWVVAPFIPTGPFDAQIVSSAAHLAMSVACALAAAAALSFAVRLRRPRWFWPVLIIVLSLAFKDLLRVVNSRDNSTPEVHQTQVITWKTTWASWRGDGKWARRVLVESWSTPGDRFEFRVPEGTVTRESGFAKAQLARSPKASMDTVMFPEPTPCHVLTRPGLLGLEHVVGLHLLLAP
jgi:hypothetical protein